MKEAKRKTERRYGLTQVQEMPCEAVVKRWQERRRVVTARASRRRQARAAG